MKKVIVFGATGSLGAYISLHLKKLGYDVFAVGKRIDDNSFFSDYNIPYLSVNIEDPNSFAILPQNDVYGILHFAGALPATMEGYTPNLYLSSIIQGTLNVLEYARTVGTDRIIYPQSLFDISYLFNTKTPIPADSLRKVPFTGDHAVYVIAKNAAVDLIEYYYQSYGIKRFILRLSRVYLYHPNPYTFTDGKKCIISDRLLIEKAIRGEDIELWGNPENLLETVAIKDFLQIVEKALEAKVDGGIYNIGSGGSTLRERIEGILEVFNSEHKKSNLIYRPGKTGAIQFTLDISKTIKDLGYTPKYKWIDYLKDFKKERELQRFKKLWGEEKDFFEL